MADLTQGHLMPGVAQVLAKLGTQPITQADIDLLTAQLHVLAATDPNAAAIAYIVKQGPTPAPATSEHQDPVAEAQFAASSYATPAKATAKPSATAQQAADASQGGGLGLPTMDWAAGLGDLIHGGNAGVDTSTGNIQPLMPSPQAPVDTSTASVAQRIKNGDYANSATADMSGTDQTRIGSPGLSSFLGTHWTHDSPPQPSTAGTQDFRAGSPIPAEIPETPTFSGDILGYPGHSFSNNPYGASMAAQDPMVWAHLYQGLHPNDTDPTAFDAQMLAAAQNLAALGALGGTTGNDLTTGPKSDAQQMALAEDFLNSTIKNGKFVDPDVLYKQILNRAAATDPSLIMATPGAGAGSQPGNADPGAQVKITNNALMQVGAFTGKTGTDTMSQVLDYMGQEYLNGIADGSIHGMSYPQWLQAHGMQNLV